MIYDNQCCIAENVHEKKVSGYRKYISTSRHAVFVFPLSVGVYGTLYCLLAKKEIGGT